MALDLTDFLHDFEFERGASTPALRAVTMGGNCCRCVSNSAFFRWNAMVGPMAQPVFLPTYFTDAVALLTRNCLRHFGLN